MTKIQIREKYEKKDCFILNILDWDSKRRLYFKKSKVELVKYKYKKILSWITQNNKDNFTKKMIEGGRLSKVRSSKKETVGKDNKKNKTIK